MEIALLLFDELTALDAVGPLEILGRLPDATLKTVAKRPGVVRAHGSSSRLGLMADHGLSEISHPDILVVPGGPATRQLVKDREIVDWIREVHQASTWTASVCSGALLLGATGLLDGVPATTHRSAMDVLAGYGADVTSRRVVEHGKIITAAGVSSGIDMGLHLAARVAGDDFAMAIQLSIEYDPRPPFDAGSLSKAPAAVRKLAGAEA